MSYPVEFLNKELPYKKYKHKDTGLEIEAVKLNNTMKDGSALFQGISKPYVIISDVGFTKKFPISKKYHLIRYKNGRFIIKSKNFYKIYKSSE